jgi:chloramphenicol-sensitive protein RarD
VIEHRRGLVFGISAYAMWGLFPLYWPLLRPAGAVEILAHRIVWSLVVVLVLVGLRRGGGTFAALRRRPGALWRLALAGAVLSVNWGVYIYGVNSAQVVETSLGYFINPLVTVVLGVVVLRERLRPAQWGAVALAAIGVLVLTVDYGRPPYIALVLAVSFGCYGLLKKTAAAGALEGLTVETTVLFLPAMGYLLTLVAAGTSTFGSGLGHSTLLAGGGVVTAVPLLFFGAAATRIPLTTVGLLQYLTPIMQLAIGVLVRHEPMPPARLAGFVLVWLALVALSADGLRVHRQQRLAVEVA